MIKRWWAALRSKFPLSRCQGCDRLIRKGAIMCDRCIDKGR